VLVLHLKRFNAFGGKLSRRVSFEEQLSLAEHMAEPHSAHAAAARYALCAVVVHSGFSGTRPRRTHGCACVLACVCARAHCASLTQQARLLCALRVACCVCAVSSGHYYAYCRAGGAWHIMDDSYVAKVAVATVLAADAYILLYQRCEAGADDAAAHTAAAPAAAPPAAMTAPLAPNAPLAPPVPLALPAPAPAPAPTPAPPAADALRTQAAQALWALRLKRLREALPEAGQRAAGALLTSPGADADGAVARTAHVLRASPWGALVMEQLRAAKRRACGAGLPPSAEQVVRAWSEGGEQREARAQVRARAPDACPLAWALAEQGLRAQLPATHRA
jgi:hypothetical protein